MLRTSLLKLRNSIYQIHKIICRQFKNIIGNILKLNFIFQTNKMVETTHLLYSSYSQRSVERFTTSQLSYI